MQNAEVRGDENCDKPLNAPTCALAATKLEHLAEDVLKDAAVMIVGDFFGSVGTGD